MPFEIWIGRGGILGPIKVSIKIRLIKQFQGNSHNFHSEPGFSSLALCAGLGLKKVKHEAIYWYSRIMDGFQNIAGFQFSSVSSVMFVVPFIRYVTITLTMKAPVRKNVFMV